MANYRGKCARCGMEVEASLTSPQGGDESGLISPPGFVYYHDCWKGSPASMSPVMMSSVVIETKTAGDLVVGDRVRLGHRLFTVHEPIESHHRYADLIEGCVVLLLEHEDGSKITPFELSADAPAEMQDGAWSL